MKKNISQLLICPVCLPREYSLQLSASREADGDVITGMLTCKRCKQRFPIQDGIAMLLPDPAGSPTGGQWRYEEKGMTDCYLWSHYADFCGNGINDSMATEWTDMLTRNSFSALDAGCSVGRMVFEMAHKGGLAVGCDLSHSFIKTARKLARERKINFSLPLEGQLTETFSLNLPDSWRTDTAEFVIADALRLPFAANSFDQIASLNLLDRVSYPLAHLFEMNRVAQDKDSSFLFAAPFSWSEVAAPVERWLGGTETGPYKGRGIDNVRALLEGKDHILIPAWTISRVGALAWKMRSHRNHAEVITSDYLVADR